jgi:hypothetical protein
VIAVMVVASNPSVLCCVPWSQSEHAQRGTVSPLAVLAMGFRRW